MCGIVGAWREGRDLRAAVVAARDSLRHRGPDDAGLWMDAAAGIVLGHTRLAILDLSAAGHQPMASPCGRYHIVFNGEIYNHLELRQRLGAGHWRGHSDTETLLACIEAWGLEGTLTAAVGMFALALFDSERRVLYLARDRFGEKPLYYGYAGGAFVFSSELKALRKMPGFDPAVDSIAFQSYMRYSYVPAPASIYINIRKLPAGSWLELTAAAASAGISPATHRYWSASEIALAGARAPSSIADEEAINGLDRVLGDAVQSQMIADVPLGAFLSGGIDSSTVVALMQARSARAVRTFSIGFDEGDFDESRQASLVAKHLGTDHTEMTARAADLLGLVHQMPHIYDEPFADSSQLPTCLVASLARRHVTVALSGDGGDELFGGYNRYFLAARNWSRIERVPRVIRRGVAAGLRAMSVQDWDRLANVYYKLARSKNRTIGEKMQKVANVIGAESAEALYGGLISQPQAEQLLAAKFQGELKAPSLQFSSELVHGMMLADATSYLPDDILVKVDRAAMASSLETRVPMLDHRVFEYAWRLPLHMKIRNGTGKWLLRQLLYRYVPQQLVQRPKMGFAVPLASWLRGPLRDWVESLLDEKRLQHDGFFNHVLVRQRWAEHLSGKKNWQYQLWTVLMFQAWLANHHYGSRPH